MLASELPVILADDDYCFSYLWITCYVGGPHCVRQVTWVTAMKPFYRDSLINLRRAAQLVLQRTMRASHFYPSQPAPELRIKNKISESKTSHGKNLNEKLIRRKVSNLGDE